MANKDVEEREEEEGEGEGEEDKFDDKDWDEEGKEVGKCADPDSEVSMKDTSDGDCRPEYDLSVELAERCRVPHCGFPGSSLSNRDCLFAHPVFL